MIIKRIIANIATEDINLVQQFYLDLFDLDIVMDHSWIVTLASNESAVVQMSIATEGGSGTPVPDLSIEVDDVDAVYTRAQLLNIDIVYDITNEPWAVRRFYVRDPADKLLNILCHNHCKK